MKKIVLFTSILLTSLIALCGCTSISVLEETEYYDYYLINSGYLGVSNNEFESTRAVISSKEELNAYIEKYDRKTYSETEEIDGELKRALIKYNDEFFKTRSLALYYVELSSGSIDIIPKDPTINGDTITVNYETNIPEIGTCDMNGYIIVIEVSKDIKNII